MLGLPFVNLQARQVRAMLEKLGASFSTDDTVKEPTSTMVLGEGDVNLIVNMNMHMNANVNTNMNVKCMATLCQTGYRFFFCNVLITL